MATFDLRSPGWWLRAAVMTAMMWTPAALLGLVLWSWRSGDVVAEATFNPGIAPFSLEVRKVPVPVTGSSHFIVELRRGQYVVTSNRYFWPDHTPTDVVIDWPCIDRFTVTFDQQHVAECTWAWGRGATWTLTDLSPPAGGLSPYHFLPRNEIPDGCAAPP